MGYQIVLYLADDVTWPPKVLEAARSAILATAWLLVPRCQLIICCVWCRCIYGGRSIYMTALNDEYTHQWQQT